MGADNGTNVRIEHIPEAAGLNQGRAVLARLFRSVSLGNNQGLVAGVLHQLLYVLQHLLEALLISADLLPDLKVSLIVQMHYGNNIEGGSEGCGGFAHAAAAVEIGEVIRSEY